MKAEKHVLKVCAEFSRFAKKCMAVSSRCATKVFEIDGIALFFDYLVERRREPVGHE
jgi:hypothetical protein